MKIREGTDSLICTKNYEKLGHGHEYLFFNDKYFLMINNFKVQH